MEGTIKSKHHIRIKVLGDWSIVRAGERLTLGPNKEAVLHALVLCRESGLDRADLESVLPEGAVFRSSQSSAVKNALWELRKLGFDIPRRRNPVKLYPSPGFSVDLWEFLDHVENEQYGKAETLLRGNAELAMIEKDADHNKLFKAIRSEFAAKRSELGQARKASSGRIGLIRDTRKRFLERTLVPGIGQQVPIREVRAKIEPVGFPWRSLQPDGEIQTTPLPGRLSEDLKRDDPAPPQRLILLGGHGTGKTLAAISTYLLLTDSVNDADAALEMRPIFFFDGKVNGLDPDFATDAWFNRRLNEVEVEAHHGVPIVIVVHADAFFSRTRRDLGKILGRKMFRECDVLLCCSEQFYARELGYQPYGLPVIRLEPWDADLQGLFAELLLGDEARAAFEAWRDDDSTAARLVLSDVPLHLAFIVPIVVNEPDALARISTRWHLLDQVARMRLKAGGLGAEEDEYFNELAAIAHRFYRPGMAPDRPIGFNLEALRDFLRARDRKAVKRRLDTIVNDTLISVPSPASDEYLFEKPLWGWFFVASHLNQVMKLSHPPELAQKALAKPFSPEVMELCEEMLCEELPLHEERILGALRAVITDSGRGQTPAQRKTAREQAQHLLETLERDRLPAENAAGRSRVSTGR